MQNENDDSANCKMCSDDSFKPKPGRPFKKVSSRADCYKALVQNLGRVRADDIWVFINNHLEREQYDAGFIAGHSAATQALSKAPAPFIGRDHRARILNNRAAIEGLTTAQAMTYLGVSDIGPKVFALYMRQCGLELRRVRRAGKQDLIWRAAP